MTPQVFPRDEILSPGLLATLWRTYNLPRLLKWRRASAGVTHVTWILSLAGDKTVVLRRYKPIFDEATIRYEHSILTYLARSEFPAPPRHSDCGRVKFCHDV